MRTLIVDGNNLAHRCRYAFDLSYRQYDVSVTYGFLRTLWSVMEQYTPDVVVVCWDGGVPDYRYEACETYKKRDHGNEEDYAEFIRQVRELDEILPLFAISSVRKVGCEADDLIYHIAFLLVGEKVVLTTDEDMYQMLLNKHLGDVVINSPVKNIEITKDNFEEVTGVKLDWEYWMTYKAFVGDSSDGIKGVQGIGPKRAKKLLENYEDCSVRIVNSACDSGKLEGMSEAVVKSVVEFGHEGFIKAARTMRLDRDMCGARAALLNEFANWQGYAHGDVVRFLKNYAFVSLIDPAFYKLFRNLRKPLLRDVDYRVPVIFAKSRRFVE